MGEVSCLVQSKTGPDLHIARLALRPSFTLGSLRTLVSLGANEDTVVDYRLQHGDQGSLELLLRNRRALHTLRTLDALGPRDTLRALDALEAHFALARRGHNHSQKDHTQEEESHPLDP
jgi:hypothetical protein